MAGTTVTVAVAEVPMVECPRCSDHGFVPGTPGHTHLRMPRKGDVVEVPCTDHHCTHHGDAPAFYRVSCDGSSTRMMRLTEDPDYITASVHHMGDDEPLDTDEFWLLTGVWVEAG